MEALIYFVLIAALFAVLKRFGCSARVKISSPHDDAHLAESGTFLGKYAFIDREGCGLSQRQLRGESREFRRAFLTTVHSPEAGRIHDHEYA